MKRELYRKISLDRLSSPEELDQLIQVTKPKGWVALLGLICILTAGIIWGFTGTIPVEVQGIGMITASEGVANVIHPVSGMITDISVEAGDYVNKGDVIARMEHPALVGQINSIKASIHLAEAFKADDFDPKRTELTQSLRELYHMALRIKNINDGNEPDEKQNLRYLKEQLETERALILSGLRKNLENKVTELEAASSIISRVEGRVLEVNAEKGEIVQAGVPVASIIRNDQTINSLEVVLYVSPEEGKKIMAGMEAHISPTIVKKEEYGFMRGKVISVSEYPVSVQSLVQTLGNDDLAEMFTEGSAPIEVRVNLIPDGATYSGFQWSTSKGPELKIESGNICSGSIVVRNRRPVEMVLPVLK